jgi:hypothetical protein
MQKIMISVLTGDIINSRKSVPGNWLGLLKAELNAVGKSPAIWEIYGGDTFQLRMDDPLEALQIAIKIKAAIKTVKPLDVRIAIGIGEMTFQSKKITECNGSAFVASGEKYNLLKKERQNLAVKSPWPEFDATMNLCLRLGLIVMDKWSVNAAEMVQLALLNPLASQSALGTMLDKRQNTVSTRLARAHFGEVMEINELYKNCLKGLL